MVSGKKCGSWSSYGQLVSNALILHALSKIGREEVESKKKKKCCDMNGKSDNRMIYEIYR